MGEFSDVLLGQTPEAQPAPGFADALLSGQPLPAVDIPPPSLPAPQQPSLGTLAASSLASELEPQVRFLASRIFPGQPFESVVGRFALDEDNQFLVDGVPIAPGFLEQAASSLGQTLPELGAGFAGMAAAPLIATGPQGLAAAAGIAGLGGAAGQGVREALAQQIIGQEPSLGRIATAGVVGTGSELGGAIAIKFINRKAARDIARFSRKNAKKVQSVAEKLGITLTPAEITGLRSLAGQQRVLANLPQSADVIGDFLKIRDEEIQDAVGRFIQNISPQGSTVVAGQELRGAANQAIQNALAERAAQASPLYQAAFASAAQVDTSLTRELIDRQLKKAAGPIASGLRRARGFLVDGDTPKTDVEALHNAKLAIDDMLGRTGPNSLGRTAKRRLMEVKDSLVQELDAASPEYAQARAIFEEGSPPVTQLQKGVVGRLADTADPQLVGMTRQIFSPAQSSPEIVASARGSIEAVNPEAWRGAVRAHLQETFETIPEAAGADALNVGAKFRKAIFGSAKKRQMMRAALTDEQFDSLKQLMDTLERTGRVFRSESITRFADEGIKELERQAKPFGAKVIESTLSPQSFGTRFSQWWTDVALGNHAEDLARIITSPEGLNRMKELKQLSPRSTTAIMGVAQLGGFNLAGVVSETLFPPQLPTIPNQQ